ncbi:MAG TPA: penicillin-binding protein 1C [Steroidobacteraceae bacterium]|jgi:penicillin-binding protein 1C
MRRVQQLRCVLGGALSAGLIAALGGWIYLSWPAAVPSYAQVQAQFVPSDAWLLDRHGEIIDSVRVRFDVRRLPWARLADISPAVVTAIVDSEDRRFYRHHGIDWRAVIGALRDELWRHQRRGASTISMQLASLLLQRHERSGLSAWIGKLEQGRTAVSLERHWGKDQILEAYLNLLPYRGELQGIGAASARLAGKSPSGLSTSESLVLAALLPQPAASGALVGSRACARASVLALPVSCDEIHRTVQAMLAATAAGRDGPWPHLAPQLAQHLLHTPGERQVVSLDADMQRQARAVLTSHLSALANRNVRDGAVLVVDNASGEVLAYVGSAGSLSRAAQVDGVQAARQAGSSLKPFLYEQALEQRYLTAASLLADAPLSVDTAAGVYLPQDYDHDFKGLVSVRTALAGSLNVPAVRTLMLVGVDAFAARLRALGYGGIRADAQYYGYSLALGSGEVTLWQQAQAYRALANGGVSSPLRLQPGAEPAVRQRLMSAAASYIVSDILSDPGARTVTFGLDNHLKTPFWSAVKTGTSEDMRDNWCIGYSGSYTVAVWVGNFEGDSMRDVSGVTGAAPVWQELMLRLQAGGAAAPPAVPPDVSGRSTRFEPSVEPERREWFINGTQFRGVVAAVPASERPTIVSPVDGMVIALDPDIPDARQRVLIALQGARSSLQLKLNDTPLDGVLPQQLWEPRPGRYELTLEDESGQRLDRVQFTVR